MISFNLIRTSGFVTIKLIHISMNKSLFLLAVLAVFIQNSHSLYFQFVKPSEKCLYEDLPKEEVVYRINFINLIGCYWKLREFRP